MPPKTTTAERDDETFRTTVFPYVEVTVQPEALPGQPPPKVRAGAVVKYTGGDRFAAGGAQYWERPPDADEFRRVGFAEGLTSRREQRREGREDGLGTVVRVDRSHRWPVVCRFGRGRFGGAFTLRVGDGDVE
eukprot:gene9153-23838_t